MPFVLGVRIMTAIATITIDCHLMVSHQEIVMLVDVVLKEIDVTIDFKHLVAFETNHIVAVMFTIQVIIAGVVQCAS